MKSVEREGVFAVAAILTGGCGMILLLQESFVMGALCAAAAAAFGVAASHQIIQGVSRSSKKWEVVFAIIVGLIGILIAVVIGFR